MMRILLEKYLLGMITDDQFIIESLQLIDPEDPGTVLSSFPDTLIPRTLRLANELLIGKIITNYGVLPARDQIVAARKWIEHSLQETADRSR